MIHYHQAELIVVVGLPELGSDAQIVVTVMRHELVSADLVPLFSRFNARCAQCVDT